MPEMWIVVCTDLHAAFGIFVDEEAATLAAAKTTATDTQGCIYMPVSLAMLGKGEDVRQEKELKRGYL